MEGQGAIEGATGAPTRGLHAGERSAQVRVRERAREDWARDAVQGGATIERTTVNEPPATITCEAEAPATITCEAEAALAARNACKRSRSETKCACLSNRLPV